VLAELAGIPHGSRVLDIGAGIGGPSRTLARHFDAEVTAVDATERFCALNEELNRRTGLADRISVVRADARETPFDDGSFEIAISEAVWQSVEDKPGLLAEAHRVLAPGGRLAIYEVLAGPNVAELEFPVPWGDGPEHSFLVSGEEAKELARAAGFEVTEWLQGPEALGPIGAKAGSGAAEMSSGVEGVDLSLVMPDFQERMAGLAANVMGQRIEPALAVFTRS
jgi:SAM-dependent methyltransferase